MHTTPDAAAIKAAREELRTAPLTPPERRAAYASHAEDVLVRLGRNLPDNWAIATTAGTARRELCPGSDYDVVLLHPKRARPDTVKAVAERIWYPLWDAGVKVSPLTNTSEGLLALAERDLATATTLLDVRPITGSADLVSKLGIAATVQWQRDARRNTEAMLASVVDREQRLGEVAFLLEPDLKDGHGGLRDVHVLVWSAQFEAFSFARPDAETLRAYATILDVRTVLHATTRKSGDRLLLQDQDEIATALGFATADDLMRAVSSAARTIAWATDEWRLQAEQMLASRRPSRLAKPLAVAPGIAFQGGQIVLAADADLHDPALVLRVAAAAAQAATVPSRDTLQQLATTWPGTGSPWTLPTRHALVSLLGAGADALGVFEALDRYRLVERVLPEWAAVRSKPQRNAYHRYTVDRHLCQAAANAATLVRQVARPDLLLVGAWLHDLGKGFPGDHTDVGVDLIAAIGRRIGFSPVDVLSLVAMVRYHLLLPDVATRRDLADPDTIASVARAVGDIDTLELLHALTIADSQATGPAAWSDWKAQLIEELVMRTKRLLDGTRAPPLEFLPAEQRHAELIQQARAHGGVVVAGDQEQCVVVAADRRGLLATLAGVLAISGIEVLAAAVATTADGIAVDELRVQSRSGADTDWARVNRDLLAALAGTLDLEQRLAERSAAYRPVRRYPAAVPPRVEVLIDNRMSASATALEVRAPDAVGLLHRLASVISGLGLDIRHAKVATLGHEVVDTFSVPRVHDPAVLAALRTELTAAAGQL